MLPEGKGSCCFPLPALHGHKVLSAMSSQASCVQDIVASAEDRYHRYANMGFIYSDCTLRVCSIPPPLCLDGKPFITCQN